MNFYNWELHIFYRNYLIWRGSFIKTRAGWYRFSILSKRCNIVVRRFSVPPILGKSIKTENRQNGTGTFAVQKTSRSNWVHVQNAVHDDNVKHPVSSSSNCLPRSKLAGQCILSSGIAIIAAVEIYSNLGARLMLEGTIEWVKWRSQSITLPIILVINLNVFFSRKF